MIFIEVIIPNSQYLRTDIKNWDRFGASQALSDEMVQFSSDIFAQPNTSNTAVSANNSNYRWVTRVGSSNTFPLINFYDDDTSTLIDTLVGTPHYQGEVAEKIEAVAKQLNLTVSKKMPKAVQAGLGILALLLLFSKIKAAK